MTKGLGKLPPSAPARAVALLLAADVALVGAIISEQIGTPLWTVIIAAAAAALFAAFVWVAIHLPSDDKRADVLHSVGRVAWLGASTLFWAVAVGLGILALAYGVAVAIPAAAPMLLYAMAFGGMALVSWSSAKAAIRKRRMLLILSHLEKAVNMGLPMPRMIEAAARNEHGLMRNRLIALHDYLDRGEPLDQALLHAVPEIPLSVARAIAAGLHMGCLGHVLEAIMRRQRRDDRTAAPGVGFYWAYPLVLVGVIGLVMVFVIPKYQVIMHEFHIDLPAPTRWLMALADNGTLVALLILVLALIPLGRALTRLFPTARAIQPFGGMFLDQLIWWTPLLGGLVRDRCMADLCDFISAGVEAGYPLNDCLREAAAAQPNAVMRYRAVAWADAVARGQTMHEAARYARMPALFTSMLATVRGDDGLLQVLRFLWRNYEYRFSRARAVAQAAYVPAVVFCFGSFVALVGMSLIQPLARLSEHISRQISGGL